MASTKTFSRVERKRRFPKMETNGEDSWKLTNIGGIGSTDDLKLRAEAAMTEDSFSGVGEEPGVDVWRVEKFELERIGALRAGNLSLYSGDAYIVLYTSVDEDGTKSYNLHYWIGDDATQDENGSVAYYTVVLDDLLGQKPVQYRETQDEETALFHSYFKSVVYLKGGIDSGFKTVQPDSYTPRLLRMSTSGKSVRVKQIDMDPELLNNSDVFLLDLGMKVYQFNAPHASPFERRRAMEIVQLEFKADRDEIDLVVIDGEQELLNCADFWAAIGGDGPVPTSLARSEESCSVTALNDDVDATMPKSLYKISDAEGTLRLVRVESEVDVLSASSVTVDDVWAIEVDGKCFFYVGAAASKEEKLAVRRHAPSLMEAMKLPRFASSTIVSPENRNVWDTLFSATLKISDGRKIAVDKCVSKPNAMEIFESAKQTGLKTCIELDKAYCRDYWVRGRIRVCLFDQLGKPLNDDIPNRKVLYAMVAKHLPKVRDKAKSAAAKANAKANAKPAGKRKRKGKR